MLWRLHIRPQPKNGKTQTDVVDYCIKHNIAGIGWPVESVPQTADEYGRLVQLRYGKRTASVAFALKPQPGDLIWARSKAGDYYLGRLCDPDGAWQYSADPVHLELDIPNQRRCVWVKAGNEASVPGKIVACFRPPGTFQAINDSTMERYSDWLYAQLSDPTATRLSASDSPITASDFFKLISAEDCEDIVGLYLQKEKGYCLIPSTCKRATIGYEYILKHPDSGQTAAVQVKQGSVPLDDQLRTVADHIFLFSTEGVTTAGSPMITILSKDELFRFVNENPRVLPLKITYWLDSAHYHPVSPAAIAVGIQA